jgi:hypothetical protein
MLRLSRINAFFPAAALFLLSACASDPKHPDPLAELLTQDESGKGDKPEVDKPIVDEPEEGTIPFGPNMARPVFIGGPTPSLPPEALANRVLGVWVARCIITEDGAVEKCKIVKGLPYSNAHLLNIVQTQKYTPVIFEGKPQRVFYTFKITFR